MGENEVMNDLGDLRSILFDLEADGTIDYRALDIIASAISEKMDKYRGKSVVIKIGWSE